MFSMLINWYSTVVCLNVDGINVNNFMRMCVKAELKELSVEYCHLCLVFWCCFGYFTDCTQLVQQGWSFVVGYLRCEQRFWSSIAHCKHLRWFSHNIQAILAKIKFPENPLSMVIFWIKVRRSCRDLSSQADPARENWAWRYPYFS